MLNRNETSARGNMKRISTSARKVDDCVLQTISIAALLSIRESWRMALHVISLARVHAVSLHPVTWNIAASTQPAIATKWTPHPLMAAFTCHGQIPALMVPNLQWTHALPSFFSAIYVLTLMKNNCCTRFWISPFVSDTYSLKC